MKGHSPDRSRLRRHTTTHHLLRVVVAGLLALAMLASPMFVAPVLAALAADPGGPYSGVVDEKVQFDGSGSTEGDEDIDEYLWNFGDGTTRTGKTTDHTYRTPGTFVVTLTVTDDDDNVSSATTTATIAANQPPVPDPGGPYFAEVNKKVKFDGSGSTDVDGKIDRYSWDFGDGKTGKGDTPDHSYQAPGVYTVTLTVRDDDDATASLSTTATIVDPDVPVPAVSITQPSPGAVLSGQATISATTTDDARVIRVEFLVDGAQIGVDSAPPWSISWNTASAGNGPHTLTVIATDTAGRTSRDSVSVTVDNSTDPTVQITNPGIGAVVTGTLSITASASDDTVRVQFFVDGISIGTDFFGFNGWSATWDTAAGPDGPHTIAATATNRQGQTATDSVAVTVSNFPTTTTTTLPGKTTTTLPGTTTTTLPVTTTSTTTPPTSTTSATTTTTSLSIPSTTGLPPQTTSTLGPTLEVLGLTLEATSRAFGLSATLFSVAPLAWVPGDEITLTLQLEAVIPGFSQVVFLLDGSPLGDPADVTTGSSLTFTRLLPDDLSVGQHRIEVVTTGDPSQVLASRSVGVAVSSATSESVVGSAAPETSTATTSLLPGLGILVLAGLAAVAWRFRRRWMPARTRM